MSFLYKILAASAVAIALTGAILLRKRFRNLMQRRKLTRMRNKSDKLIASNTAASKEKCDALVNKFFEMYETSVYIQKEDQIRIQELNQIRKKQRETSSQL